MIKEKEKITKYNYKKPKSKVFLEYFRTFFVSFIIAVIITSALALHARNEMLNNLYIDSQEQSQMDKETALKLVLQQDLLKDINKKSASVCIHVGDLYMSAGDYKDAKLAYEIAVQKSSIGSYKAHYKLLLALMELEEFDKAFALLDNIKDKPSKKLLNFKTRAYIVIGDKYYSLSKFLSAVKSYKKADHYYSRFSKTDKNIVKGLKTRIVNSYVNVADLMVKAGRNTDALRYLKKAESYLPEDITVKYKLAIVLSDLDPEKSVEYFEKLFEEVPQDIDYAVYCRALMKAANIADLDGRTSKAKYYRYKIHSLDLFLNRKVLYKNDIDVAIQSIKIKKNLFVYKVSADYTFENVSNIDLINLYGDFELTNGKTKQIITKPVASKDKPLYMYEGEPNKINVSFDKKFWTKKELDDYIVIIRLYKDKRFKTEVLQHKIVKDKIKETLWQINIFLVY